MRNSIARTFVLTLGLTVAAFGQTPDVKHSAGMLNGRFWQDIGLEGKLGYLSAYMDFSTYNVLTGWKNDKDPSQYKWATGFVITDYLKELDSLYSHTENLNIPVSMAIPYCTVKLRGEASSSAVESLIIDLRKLANSMPR
jgi:hypothetical protein